MGRLPQSAAKPRNTPYSRQKPRGRPSKSSVTPSRSVDNPLMNCECSPDGERLTFVLRNGSTYTISPAESSPEHFWGTIYSAEWKHPNAREDCTCAIKASDFLLRQKEGNDSRAEYRRPRQDYEREVQAFQMTRHRNVVEMHDFWEWEGRGYIAMKKLKGSLGDVLYEPAYRRILDLLRSDECILAELLRQVLLSSPWYSAGIDCVDFGRIGSSTLSKYHLSRRQTRQSSDLIASTDKACRFRQRAFPTVCRWRHSRTRRDNELYVS